ncbi:hypothetical protein BU25DRAFT_471205, partial [Macroventuria anomochaeta]
MDYDMNELLDFSLLVNCEIWGSDIFPEHWHGMPVLNSVQEAPRSAAQPQAEARITSPTAPKAPTLGLSQVKALDISPTAPKAPTLGLSQVKALDISPTAPKAPYYYEPIQPDKGNEIRGSRRQTSTADDSRATTREASNSIITDTNDGQPIVIDDTEDEMSEPEAKSAIDGQARIMAKCKNAQPSKRNFRKRQEVQWVRPGCKANSMLPVLKCMEDKNIVKETGSIIDDGDTSDGDYRPSKKRRP